MGSSCSAADDADRGREPRSPPHDRRSRRLSDDDSDCASAPPPPRRRSTLNEEQLRQAQSPLSLSTDVPPLSLRPSLGGAHWTPPPVHHHHDSAASSRRPSYLGAADLRSSSSFLRSGARSPPSVSGTVAGGWDGCASGSRGSCSAGELSIFQRGASDLSSHHQHNDGERTSWVGAPAAARSQEHEHSHEAHPLAMEHQDHRHHHHAPAVHLRSPDNSLYEVHAVSSDEGGLHDASDDSNLPGESPRFNPPTTLFARQKSSDSHSNRDAYFATTAATDLQKRDPNGRDGAAATGPPLSLPLLQPPPPGHTACRSPMSSSSSSSLLMLQTELQGEYVSSSAAAGGGGSGAPGTEGCGARCRAAAVGVLLVPPVVLIEQDSPRANRSS